MAKRLSATVSDRQPGLRLLMPGWRVDEQVQPDGTVHVWPDAPDVIDHDLTGSCVCGPFLEEQPNGLVMVVHHSLDGRERSERA